VARHTSFLSELLICGGKNGRSIYLVFWLSAVSTIPAVPPYSYAFICHKQYNTLLCRSCQHQQIKYKICANRSSVKVTGVPAKIQSAYPHSTSWTSYHKYDILSTKQTWRGEVILFHQYHTREPSGGLEVQFHGFLTSELDGLNG
jgi:hypothetical protein